MRNSNRIGFVKPSDLLVERPRYLTTEAKVTRGMSESIFLFAEPRRRRRATPTITRTKRMRKAGDADDDRERLLLENRTKISRRRPSAFHSQGEAPPGAPQAPAVLDDLAPRGQAALRSRPLRLARDLQVDDRPELCH
jgi:hypothetical protein